jgi:hypothetical protein
VPNAAARARAPGGQYATVPEAGASNISTEMLDHPGLAYTSPSTIRVVFFSFQYCVDYFSVPKCVIVQ